MQERLQKILSARGVASRRKSEQMIQNGFVTVNGIPAALGDSADPEFDEIFVNGQPLPFEQRPVYILLNKPRGYVTTLSDEKGRPNAAQLVADCGTRVYPVGRHDIGSEGPLLLTNDGGLDKALTHPKQEVEKVDEVWVSGYRPGGEEMLRRPIVLDGYRIRPPKVMLVSANGEKAKFRVTIHEGRNRQIRRMCEEAGMRWPRLRRIREGRLSLGKRAVGKWRYLTGEEVSKLK